MSNSAQHGAEPDSGYERLEAQIAWYDEKSASAQWWYKHVKIVEFGCGAIIPLIATINGIATAILGAIVIVLEGFQQVNQWHSNWITYRSTCEALRHEKYTYLGGAGVYENLAKDEAKRVLVERVESLVSTEHAKWISRQEYEPEKPNEAAKAGN